MFQYEWDPEKSITNNQKHAILFSEAVTVFEDDYSLTIEDERQEEQRYVTVGMDSKGRILVVVYTFREQTIRIISARKATAREESEYEANTR